HVPGTPLRRCSPASSSSISDPTVAAYGLGDQDFAGGGEITDPSTDCYGEARDVVVAVFDFPGVDACAYGQPDAVRVSNDLGGAVHRSSCAVEGGEEAVARGPDLASLVPVERVPDPRIVIAGEVGPGAVPEPGGLAGRVHNVGEQHCR